MNKTELVDAVAQAAELSKVAAGKALDAVLATVGKACLLYTSRCV